MKNILIYCTIFCTIFVMFCAWGIDESHAQIPGKVAIHGFGGWAYGRTDNENRYLNGDEDGDYNNVNFSLNISARPYEKLSVHFQSGYNETGDKDSEVVLDYAFAEWLVSDAFIIRAGKVKAPFMLYTEVYDVGTIRPFFTLPQGVYHQLAAEAYKGLGITGTLFTMGDWDLLYDLYGGKLDLQPNSTINVQEMTPDVYTPVLNDMLGGRLTVHTPLTGFNICLSVYTGDADFSVNGTIQDDFPLKDRYTLIGASAEYLSDRWWIRSEYLTQRDSPKVEVDVVYAEIAFFLTEHWQAAARYELADFTIALPDFVYLPQSFVEHEELVVGLNYWVNPYLAFKASYHSVKGNRFVYPANIEDFLAAAQKGSFDETTHLISFGVQFSF